MPKPMTPEAVADKARYAAERRRAKAAERKMSRKLQRIYTDLLDLEQFALTEGGIFMQDHMHLQWSSYYLSRVLDIYAPKADCLNRRLAPVDLVELPPDFTADDLAKSHRQLRSALEMLAAYGEPAGMPKASIKKAYAALSKAREVQP